jgi:hypothetical protein
MPEWTRVTLDSREAIDRAIAALRQAGCRDQDIGRELTLACLVDLDLLREAVRTH